MMGKPSKVPAEQPTTVTRDIGVATAQTLSGFPVELENRQGMVYFVFHGDPEKLKQVETNYWNGSLMLCARDLLATQRVLKSRLYALKGAGGR